MQRPLVFLWLFCAVLSAEAQPRKMPNISFKEHSTEFADANRAYNENDQYTDTLFDQRILDGLVKIMEKNAELIIEVGGHTALNEDTTLALQRADVIRQYLVEKGVDSSRVVVKGYAHRKPIINGSLILSLPTREEKDAANQKNRRVEVKVIGVTNEEEDSGAE